MSRSPSRGLFAHVQSYFTEYLPRQRGASVHTIRAYRDALALLFKGNAAFGPVAGIASIVLFTSIVIFVFNVWRNSDS